jgi:rhamnulokinase
MPERRFAAVDLGAQSGRVAIGRFAGDRIELEIAHRFINRAVWLPDGLHWNMPGLFVETLAGLALAAARGGLDGVGVDSWGCDYALLDDGHRMLGLPYHYRDPARTAPTWSERAFTRVGRHEMYLHTGIQTMPINTVFQLLSEADAAAVRTAARIVLVPDLFGLWLTGMLSNELTIASTTGLLEASEARWARDLIERLGLPTAPFDGEVTSPGVELGRILPGHTSAGSAVGAIVRTVAGHDTACAFAATPLVGPGSAVLSSGTWSLLGIELSQPQLGPDAEAFNLTNERGWGGTVRLLRNVMGMWLIEECRRELGDRASSYGELFAAAAAAQPEVPLFDPDAPSLLHPGSMTDRIGALYRAAGEETPEDTGVLIRSILVSLACKYRLVLERLETVSGHQIDRLQVVGGGSRNGLLCQITADILGREVLAGPAEATLLGNVLVQLAATGELGTLSEMRELSGRSFTLERYTPSGDSAAESTYQRFLDVTELTAGHPLQTGV